jgi:4-hydroxybenzoate polyprenyltransferase
VGVTVARVRGRPRRLRRTATAYAELVRVPNLFTAPPDVIAGAALAVAAGGAVSLPSLAGLVAASMLLYAGGTALNDCVDAPEDATARPERPVPSGRVSRTAAGLVAGASLAGAVVVAAVTAGPDAGLVAGAVAVGVVTYDALLGAGPASALAMGAVRGANVVLGTTAVTSAPAELPAWLLAVPVVVAVYVAGVTHMAAGEATGADRRAVAVAGLGAAAATVAAVALLGTAAVDVATAVPAAFAGGFAVVVGRALRRAYRDPSPGTVGPAVGTCVLALVALDAAVAGVAGPRWTLAAAAFAGPAVGLARTFDVS